MQERLTLRPAALQDRKMVYGMLACSEATSQMMGPPDYSDHPVPDFAEFCADYDEEAFSPGGDFRIYIMVADGKDIGVIHYWLNGQVAEIDMWIGSREHWGQGYGSAAIGLVADRLRSETCARSMIIRPSARNRRAIAAYRKGGFEPYDPKTHQLPGWCLSEGFDYADAVVLVQDLMPKRKEGGL